MSAGELDPDAGAAEAVDRLPVEAIGGLAVAQQRSRAGLDPQRPVGAAGASRLREPLEGVAPACGLPDSGGRLDELGKPLRALRCPRPRRLAGGSRGSKLIATATLERGGPWRGSGLALIDCDGAVPLQRPGRMRRPGLGPGEPASTPKSCVRWGLVEFIEAATRIGKATRGGDALQRLSETTRASGTDWALGIEARSRALLSNGEGRRSPLPGRRSDRLGRTRVRVELARAHLLYGECSAAHAGASTAREQLRTAYEMFAHDGRRGVRRTALNTSCWPRARPPVNAPSKPPASSPSKRPRSPGSPRRPLKPRNRRAAVHKPPHRPYHLRKVFTKLDIHLAWATDEFSQQPQRCLAAMRPSRPGGPASTSSQTAGIPARPLPGLPDRRQDPQGPPPVPPAGVALSDPCRDIGWPCRYIWGGLLPADCPPSIGMTAPVTNEDSGEHQPEHHLGDLRHGADPAHRRGQPGQPLSLRASGFEMVGEDGPGATTLTRIP